MSETPGQWSAASIGLWHSNSKPGPRPGRPPDMPHPSSKFVANCRKMQAASGSLQKTIPPIDESGSTSNLFHQNPQMFALNCHFKGPADHCKQLNHVNVPGRAATAVHGRNYGFCVTDLFGGLGGTSSLLGTTPSLLWYQQLH